MRATRAMGTAAVLLAAVAGCTGGDAGAGFDAGGGDASRPDATAYDAGAPGEGGSDAGGDATTGGDDGAAGDDATVDGAAEGGPAAPDAGGGGEGSSSDGGDAATWSDDASADGGDAASRGDDASAGAADASDGGGAPVDAGAEAGIVAPTCDGVIGAGEYGGAGHQATSGGSAGQTWSMTWDDTNLYVAIQNANVAEGSVVYLSTGSAGLTSGQVYDITDLTTLPFAADLVVYANAGYVEARRAGASAWGSADTASARVCTTGPASADREEVIPWSLVGGRPASVGWLGYVAAGTSGNPQGYIYGQMPADDPGGAPANSETYAHYFGIADATPGASSPFADEH